MEQPTKKLIAREFLIFTLTLGISLLVFISTFLYNFYQKEQLSRLQKLIKNSTEVSDSMSVIFDKKIANQEYFYSELQNGYGNFYKNKEELFSRLDFLIEKDSIKIKWEKEWSKELLDFHHSLGFETPESFTEFVIMNKVSKSDSSNKIESNKLKKDVDQFKEERSSLESKVLTMKNQLCLGLIALIIMILILFLGRYIIYGIRWSIKTLNEK